MTTTPLPPLPSTLISGQYTSSDMKAFAKAARADLEAEVKRLREALSKLTHVLDFEDLMHDDQRKAYELARAALKETP